MPHQPDALTESVANAVTESVTEAVEAPAPYRAVRAARDRRYREQVPTTVFWLIRGTLFAGVGFEVFLSNSLGPMALPLIAAAYAVCGVLLAGWAAVVRWEGGPWQLRPVLLGLIAVLACASAGPGDSSSMAALAVIAMVDAATDLRIASGWSVFGAGVLASIGGGLAVDATATKTFGTLILLAFGLVTGFNRRVYRVRAEQSAALLRQSEQLRAEQRRSAVLDERARLAREIHDVLAHSLGALGIQIQAARALLERQPGTERADDMLASAQRMASDGLVETRRAVSALRSDRLPLDVELTAMAEAHEQRHRTPVAVRVDGGPVPLAPDQALALVRAAQESLVNAAKHATAQPVDLTLTYQDDAVTMTVTNPLDRDDGLIPSPGPAPSPGLATVDGGYGLTGMRERLLLLGGSLSAGSPDGTRWSVTARVPR